MEQYDTAVINYVEDFYFGPMCRVILARGESEYTYIVERDIRKVCKIISDHKVFCIEQGGDCPPSFYNKVLAGVGK